MSNILKGFWLSIGKEDEIPLTNTDRAIFVMAVSTFIVFLIALLLFVWA